MNHVTLIFLSGGLWVGVGTFLLGLGLNLLATAGSGVGQAPLLNTIAPLVGGGEFAAVILIGVALLIGRMKARVVFSKVVNRVVSRIVALEPPVSLSKVYGWPYLLLVAVMIGLGSAMRLLQVPGDIRGLIDVAVGSALLSGGVAYFRCAALVKRQSQN